jgi:hypothetical protein
MNIPDYEIKKMMDDIHDKHCLESQGGENWDGALNIFYCDLLEKINEYTKKKELEEASKRG